MKRGNNVRLRADGRYEARYIKDRDENGKIIYGYCYGRTMEEAVDKRNYQLNQRLKPKELKLLIFGAGTHGQDVFEIAKSLRIFQNISFLDDLAYQETGIAESNMGSIIGKWKDAEKYAEEYPVAIVAVGDEDTRRLWTERLSAIGFIIPTLVHPTAFVPEDTKIGRGTVICARATIAMGVSIGAGCIITSGATVPRKIKIPDWGYYDFDKLIHYREVYDV